MTTRRRLFWTIPAIALGLFVVFVWLWWLYSAPDVVAASSWEGAIKIVHPADDDPDDDLVPTHPAGSPLTLTVYAGAPDGEPVSISFFGSVDASSASSAITEGFAAFDVPRNITNHAGLLLVTAQVGQSRAQSEFVVVPGPPVDPVVSFVGPRTIVADLTDKTLVVTSPVDRWENPVANGTVVTLSVQRPQGDAPEQVSVVDGGVAATMLYSGQVTGRTIVSSSSGDATGPNSAVDEVAGQPRFFGVSVDSRNAIADGFSLHQIETTELRDLFDNVLPDGVAATFVIDSDQGRTLVNAVVQNGVATANLKAPATAGPISIHAFVSGARSTTTEVPFVAAVTSMPLEVQRSGDQFSLAVGPVISARTGGYAPDGTVVRVLVDDVAQPEQTLRGGITEVPLPDLTQSDLTGRATTITVTILGTTKALEVEP